MYEDYWQLKTKPFEPGLGNGAYYPAEAHQGTLLKLRYGVENRRDAALLVGPSGVGKTMLVGELHRQLPDTVSPWVHVVFPQMSSGELLAYLADELGSPKAEARNGAVDQSVRRVRNFLVGNAREGRHAVVIVDEVHSLVDGAALETLRLLMNFEHHGRPTLTLLLVGQPSILPALSRMPPLDERLSVKALLPPFTLEETISYINHRLAAAGAARTIFEETALEAVHSLTHGIARQINRLCDLGLLVGYAEQRETITADQVESVCEELVALAPP
jgi:general secretion pathway protein A